MGKPYDTAPHPAPNITENISLFRPGFTVYLVEMACQIAMTVLFYDLLKPVDKSLSLLAAGFELVGCTIKILARLFYRDRARVLWAPPPAGRTRRWTAAQPTPHNPRASARSRRSSP